MNITYEDLYNEYKRAICVQDKIIRRNSEALAAARKTSNYKEIKRLNSLLLVLRAEKSELEERARGLYEYIN